MCIYKCKANYCKCIQYCMRSVLRYCGNLKDIKHTIFDAQFLNTRCFLLCTLYCFENFTLSCRKYALRNSYQKLCNSFWHHYQRTPATTLICELFIRYSTFENDKNTTAIINFFVMTAKKCGEWLSVIYYLFPTMFKVETFQQYFIIQWTQILR